MEVQNVPAPLLCCCHFVKTLWPVSIFSGKKKKSKKGFDFNASREKKLHMN